MTDNRIRSIAIVGGGTAGWMTAASLSKFLKNLNCRIQLIESELIGTISGGEATIPPIIDFIKALGIDENDIIRKTKVTFKLGIEFKLTRLGHSYLHPFTNWLRYGASSLSAYWLKMLRQGKRRNILCAMAALANSCARFARRARCDSITYALHLDAGLFARYLRDGAQARGVLRTEGKVKQVARPQDGFIGRSA